MNNEKLRAEILGVINTYPLSGNTELLNRCFVALGEQQSAPEGWWQVIHDTLRYYSMATLVDEEGNGYPLIDAMTADSQTVSGGIEECTYLADAIWNALIAAAPSAPAAQGWIPVSERLPDGIVLAHYRNHYGTGRTIRAQYVRPFTEEADADYDNVECCTYSEQDDCYYLEQGWYEQIDNWGDYSSVAVTEGQVTHWMPLPAAPAAQGGE